MLARPWLTASHSGEFPFCYKQLEYIHTVYDDKPYQWDVVSAFAAIKTETTSAWPSEEASAMAVSPS